MEIWIQSAKDFGVPVVFLVAIAYAAWQVCKWLGPRIDKLIDAHLAFLNKTGDAIAEQTPKVADIQGKVDEIHQQVVHAA